MIRISHNTAETEEKEAVDIGQHLFGPYKVPGSGNRLHNIAAILGILTVLVLFVPMRDTHAAPSMSARPLVTIDFSTHGEGVFQADFYRKVGVIFTTGSFVGFIQGDQALVGPIAGTFSSPVSSLSVRIAPALQGTAEYTLTAWDASRKVIRSVSAIVMQDTGDPATGLDGYFTLDLGNLPHSAKYFALDNLFIRSSFPNTTSIPFGVSSLSFATAR